MSEKLKRLTFADRRRRGIGGSDVAPILGLSKFRNAWDVLAAKRGLKPRKPEEQEEDHLLIGRLMEPVVAALYERHEGKRLIVPPGFIRHPEHEFIIANPDRFVEGEERGAEIKTCGIWGRADWGDEGTDQVPTDYLMQSVHYMAVTGWNHWDVPVLFHGSRYALFVIERDIDLERWVLDRLTAWWKTHIIDGWDLPLDNSEGCAEFIALRYPRNDKPMAQASADAVEAAQRLAELRKSIDVIESKALGLENIIKDEIGESEGIAGPFGKATWKRTKDSEVTDWQAVAEQLLKKLPKEEAAQLVAACKKIKPGHRRFMLMTTKEDTK